MKHSIIRHHMHVLLFAHQFTYIHSSTIGHEPSFNLSHRLAIACLVILFVPIKFHRYCILLIKKNVRIKPQKEHNSLLIFFMHFSYSDGLTVSFKHRVGLSKLISFKASGKVEPVHLLIAFFSEM